VKGFNKLQGLLDYFLVRIGKSREVAIKNFQTGSYLISAPLDLVGGLHGDIEQT